MEQKICHLCSREVDEKDLRTDPWTNEDVCIDCLSYINTVRDEE